MLFIYGVNSHNYLEFGWFECMVTTESLQTRGPATADQNFCTCSEYANTKPLTSTCDTLTCLKFYCAEVTTMGKQKELNIILQ